MAHSTPRHQRLGKSLHFRMFGQKCEWKCKGTSMPFTAAWCAGDNREKSMLPSVQECVGQEFLQCGFGGCSAPSRPVPIFCPSAFPTDEDTGDRANLPFATLRMT